MCLLKELTPVAVTEAELLLFTRLSSTSNGETDDGVKGGVSIDTPVEGAPSLPTFPGVDFEIIRDRGDVLDCGS